MAAAMLNARTSFGCDVRGLKKVSRANAAPRAARVVRAAAVPAEVRQGLWWGRVDAGRKLGSQWQLGLRGPGYPIGTEDTIFVGRCGRRADSCGRCEVAVVVGRHGGEARACCFFQSLLGLVCVIIGLPHPSFSPFPTALPSSLPTSPPPRWDAPGAATGAASAALVGQGGSQPYKGWC